MYKNIYYTPESFGLEAVFDVDKSSGSYEFDQFVIWKDSHGRYYWDSDSGCSCPSPFEDADLQTIKQGSLRDAISDARAWLGTADFGDEIYHSDARAAIERFASKHGF